MKTNEQRINNIIGQLNGIKHLLTASKDDCFEVVTQLKAARAALDALLVKVLSDEALPCLSRQPVKQAKLNKILKEIVK
ncbi:transcriptional regulator [Candidatus Falkowbacteria bacterium]|jgi:DNA-binding FrmR family transcriptional regulator|nr:metal-sensing transcriptional repressor [Patescibacteria group bacterium]MDD3435120.1 metal-sensing transcriptional repressor [Patescibacteria group bacterium]MDD4466424.1 metal-sensing transcriptional repressor [Patescibacteria group bacterium]NCU42744.1 transcriptional regulator [Candidatus Falkowbacteria bacterium]